MLTVAGWCHRTRHCACAYGTWTKGWHVGTERSGRRGQQTRWGRLALVLGLVGASLTVVVPAQTAHAAVATPTYVQGRANEATSGTTNSVAFSTANAAGNLIVAYAIWDNAATATVTDTRANTYTPIGTPTRWNGGLWSSQLFYAKNIGAGANTVRVTLSSAVTSWSVLYVHEYSGIDRTAPLDVAGAGIGTSAAMDSGARTTTNANDLIVGAGASDSQVNATGTGFTTRLTTYGNRTEDRNVTTAGSYSATARQNQNAWVMHMAAFKADAGTADTTPPSVPTGLTASAPSPTQVALSWNSSTDAVGVTGYRVFRDGVLVGTTATAAYTDNGRTASTQYSYTVAAYDAAGNVSGQSAAATVTTPAAPDTTPPSAPTGLSATGYSPSQVNLSWSPSTDNVSVAGYRVFRNGTQVGAPGTTLYQDTGLTPSTTYSYTVAAVDGAGNVSAQSAAVNGTTQAAPADTGPPTVALTAPSSGATVLGTTTLSATASDDTGVLGVQFLLDGANLGVEDTTAPYSFAWDTTSASNGTHAIAARARDGASHLTTSAPVTVTVNNPATPAGLVAGYALDEGQGTTTADASPNSFTGTLTGGPSWATGHFGQAVALDGVDDNVNLGAPAAFQFAGSMTASAWIYPTGSPGDDAVIVSKRAGTGFQLDTTVDVGPRVVGFKLTSSTGQDMMRYGSTPLQLNTWYFVSGVYDAAARTMSVYVNGALDNGPLAGTVSPAQQNPTGTNVLLGQRSSGSYNFIGRLDNVRLYGRALSTTELQADMNSPLGSAASPDPTPPTVSVTAPTAGATVSDIVNVTATATDNVGVLGVQFSVDGTTTGVEDTTAPYGLAWDTRTSTNGSHTLTARARDAAGNVSVSAGVTVNVSNTNRFQNETLATGMSLPTAMKFLPDGRLLVSELAGRIRVLPAPYLNMTATPFLTISNIGSAGVQQGIYDFALDPNFATNRYFYVFYTQGTPNRDRLSRFTANATLDGTVAGSELPLYDDPQNADAEHHGGAIMFGNDGKLYFTTGEHFQAGLAQDLTNPRGKVHRINFNGTVPTDNPFYDGAGPNWDSVWAYGLRNPFRAFYDSATGRMFVGDVGGNDYSTAKEEVNLISRGGNYGWPNYEGACPAPCTSPIHTWPHNGRDSAVVGGFVYHGTAFPAGYEGSYFFADYTQNWIKRLTFDASGNVSGVVNFEPADGSVDGPYGDIVYLVQGPDENLYYLDLGYSDISGTYGVSKLRRIRYVTSDRPPVVNASADTTSGPAPLTVNFSSAGSSDPEGKPLTYSWDFGDNLTSTAANPSHAYTSAGTYTARLTVSDGVNSASSVPMTIAVGSKPTATILSPSDGALFVANQVITYSGNATDPVDGTLPASAYTWNIDFLHEGHVHPGTPVNGVKSGSFTIPDVGHDFSGNTRYRITLTVTNASGLTDTRTVYIWPTKVNLSFDTLPDTGLTLYLDGIAKTTPFVYDALVGFHHTIEARPQSANGKSYAFSSWSDGGAQNHVVTVPSSDATYRATYAVTTSTAPVAFVQVAAATPQSPQTTVQTPLAQAQAAGDLNVVVVGWNDVVASVSTVVDSTGNTYQLAAPTTRGTATSQAVYYAKNIKAAAANTVSVTFDRPAAYVDVRTLEYSGIDPASPLLTSASSWGTSATATSGDLSTTATNVLLVGAGTTTGAFTGPGTGYTPRIITSPDLDIAEDRVTAVAGTFAATASQSGSYVMQLVAFKGAAP